MLRFAEDLDEALRLGLGYDCPEDALLDPRGRTVRCTPRRRTVAGPRVGGRTLYRKLRRGPGGAREWKLLHQLGERGFQVPAPVCLAEAAGRSVVVCLEVAGRPLDALLAEAARDGSTAIVDYCCRQVAPLVRRLHDLGWFHRDLYWNHLYTAGLDQSPSLIDVERTFRPLCRRRRWQIKDLASLLSSTPPGLPRAAPLRFLRAYLGRGGRLDRRLLRAILRKARRIQSHQPKYG